MSPDETFRELPWRQMPFLEVFKRAGKSLLSGYERQMCHWLAKEWYSGAGAIVDLGSFLGSSTVAFAAGLAEREDSAGHVHAYDLFRVSRDPETQKFLNKQEGDSFLENYQATIAGYEDRITTHAGDIKQFPWTGGPIEILFIDLAKSWEMNEFIIRAFFPFLIPGKSLIIHQDFGNAWNPWLPVSMGYLDDYVTILCDESTSRVFHYHQAIPDEVLQVNYKTDLDRGTRLACMQKSLDAADGWILHRLHGAMAIITFIEDGKEAGLAYIDRVLAGLQLADDQRAFLEQVRYTIDFWNHGWAYEREIATKF
jgi:hypothetical protein